MRKLYESIMQSRFEDHKIDESILDNDKQVSGKTLQAADREAISQWMKYATGGDCEERKDWYFDDNNNVHIIGRCMRFKIDEQLRKMNLLDKVRIIDFEPSSTCVCNISDPEAAEKLIGYTTVGKSGYTGFRLVYETKEDIEPRHFPAFVNGSIFIRTKGNLNLCIMPNCSEELHISYKVAKSVKFPAGFPESVKKINIAR